MKNYGHANLKAAANPASALITLKSHDAIAD